MMTVRTHRIFFLIFVILLIFFLSVLTSQAGEKPTRPVETFRKAKELARDKVYFDKRITFYCGCYFDPKGKSGGMIDFADCGFEHPAKRARRLEWEHVVPASRLAGQRACWQTGHDLCISTRSGRSFKGRKCCEKRGVDAEARHMINDLHNLTPSIGQVNGDRSNHPYGIVDGEPRNYGTCDFEVGGSPKVAEPNPHIRGNTARIWIYMADTWGISLTQEEIEMFRKWDAADPVGEWEKIRDGRIEEIQGNTNPFVTE